MKTENHTAFLEAYQPNHEAFVRYCTAIAYGKIEAEDLVQDVLATAWKNFDQLRDRDKLLHYMMKVAKHRVYSFLRKPRYQEEIADNHSESLRSKGVSADMILEIQGLYTMLDRLPTLQKQAIILHEISGFSMKEIAVMQDSTEGAVKTKISRGRAKLKAFYESDTPQVSISSVFQTIQSITL